MTNKHDFKKALAAFDKLCVRCPDDYAFATQEEFIDFYASFYKTICTCLQACLREGEKDVR